MLPQLRRYTNAQRVEIARRISSRVLDKYGSDVLAVCVSGSTSKKLDRAFSDLELIVVVRDGVEIPMKYYLFQGLIIQIDYLQSSRFLRAAEQFTDNWHWEGDQYRNRIVLYERGEWFRDLDEAVRKNDKADSTEAIRKSFMMMTESIAVLKNDLLTNDKIGILSRARVIADDAARIVLLFNRKYVITTSWFWKIVFECPEKPEDFKSLVEKMCGFVSTSEEEAVAASERMYRELYQLVKDLLVGIENSNLLV